MVVSAPHQEAHARVCVNVQDKKWDIRNWITLVGGWKLYNKTDAVLKLSTRKNRVARIMLTSNGVSKLCGCSRQMFSAKLHIGRAVISDVKPSTKRVLTGNNVTAIHTTQVGSSIKFI